MTTLYDELPVTPDGRHHAWDHFAGDERGCLSLLTDARVREAAAEIRTGQRVRLSVPLGTFRPSLSRNRGELRHSVRRTRGGGDDSLDNFYLQESSQWDGLAHVRYREHGFFGGREVDSLDAGELGLDRVAPVGVTGRGVLIDIARYQQDSGADWHPEQRYEITTADLDQTLKAQATEVWPGDIVLVRTGWVGYYLALRQAGRDSLRSGATDATLSCAGLSQGDSMPRWLWNHQVAAVAADNPALEALPVPKGSGFLHRYLIPLLGLPIGELWFLESLGEQCARSGRWSFFLASVPLHLSRGVGSPNNAVAIF